MLTIKLIQVGIMNKMQKSGEEINPHRFSTAFCGLKLHIQCSYDYNGATFF